MDELDATVRRLDRKWGVGRLPLLVDAELRKRFQRQAELYWKAGVFGDAEARAIQTAGLVKAWRALDEAAEAAGLTPLVREGMPNDQDLPPVDWDEGDDIDDLFPPAGEAGARNSRD